MLWWMGSEPQNALRLHLKHCPTEKNVSRANKLEARAMKTPKKSGQAVAELSGVVTPLNIQGVKETAL